METVLKDLRYALRKMLRSPGFTAVALISLAIGIGTNAAVFALVEDILSHVDAPGEKATHA